MLQTSFVYYVVPLFLAYLLWNVLSKPKDAFPSIGPSGPVSSFIGAFQFLTQGRRMVHEGYAKYAGRVFRVPGFTHWTHVVSGLERMREVISAPDIELSMQDAANETFQLDYTMGTEMAIHPYGTGVIRGALTQNLARRFVLCIIYRCWVFIILTLPLRRTGAFQFLRGRYTVSAPFNSPSSRRRRQRTERLNIIANNQLCT
ncbi:hypothetical protein B0H16DRAFT_1510214 [Mycena metata]|uniref:Cytochrome P450 n=1 Tax=Mycena metata TaxID=1033252 RepID=A0AAD7JZS3_9AGAR|nr:hypothetical protein B0H16DRAFT_1510214 [Mycena metata]